MARTVKGYRRVKKYLNRLITKGERKFRAQISGREDLLLATLLSAMSKPHPKNSDSNDLYKWLKSGNGLYLVEFVHILSGSRFEPRRNYHKLTETSVLVGIVFYHSQEYEDLRIEWINESWPEKGFEIMYYDDPQRDFDQEDQG